MKNKGLKSQHSPSNSVTLGLTEEDLEFPKMVVVNTTYLCNAECIHCPYTNSMIRSEDRAQQFPFMSEKTFKIIADQVGEHKATLRISGAGEPFIHKRIVEYIQYAKSKNCQVGIISNGSLTTEDKIKPILESGVDMIEFSVDAADPETYARVRKGLNFENTVSNIVRTVNLRDKLKAETNIIASVVNQKIVDERIEEIVAFWDDIVDTVQVRKYLTWDINDLENSGSIDPYLTDEEPCPFPFDRILIDTNGDARFCVYDIKGRTNWGNILTDLISDIWSGEKFSWLRDIHLRKRFQEMEICHKCLDRQFRSWNYNYFYLRKKATRKK